MFKLLVATDVPEAGATVYAAGDTARPPLKPLSAVTKLLKSTAPSSGTTRHHEYDLSTTHKNNGSSP
jgi:hypothetical protein